MIDIVTRFSDATEALGFTFVYGTNSVLNLIDADPEGIEADASYLLLLPVTRRPQLSQTGGVNAIIHNVRFMLVAQNSFDHMEEDDPEQYYYQKYLNRVVPMLANWESLQKIFVCPGLIFTQIVIEEVVNQFNSNLDGILVTAQVQVNTQSFYSPIVPPENGSE